jgi:DNA-binding MarR family transcriptional regulator
VSPLAQERSSGVAFKICKAARAVTQLFDEMTLILEPVSVTQLAEATVTDRTTLTRNRRLLEHQGLIQVDRGHDWRAREVRLMDRGRDVLAHVYPV